MTVSNQEKNRFVVIPSYGRRRSHGISEAQKDALLNLANEYGITLPTKILDPSIFFTSVSKIFVEIGFGAGEHLIQNAIKNPKIGFIGCEPFENGVAKALKAIHDNNLKNVKIFNGDARFLLDFFENSSIDRFYILFPDPWTKKRHHKRRLLSKEFIIKTLYSKLKPCGELIIAKDCENYMEEIAEIINNASEFSAKILELEQLQIRPEWFISTRYEQKAISHGKKPYYLKVERK